MARVAIGSEWLQKPMYPVKLRCLVVARDKPSIGWTRSTLRFVAQTGEPQDVGVASTRSALILCARSRRTRRHCVLSSACDV